jgi:hypothetical protein
MSSNGWPYQVIKRYRRKLPGPIALGQSERARKSGKKNAVRLLCVRGLCTVLGVGGGDSSDITGGGGGEGWRVWLPCSTPLFNSLWRETTLLPALPFSVPIRGRKKMQRRQDRFCTDTCIIFVRDPVQGHLTVPRMLFNSLVGFLEEIISPNLTLLSSVGFHYVSEGRTTQKDIARELRWHLGNLTTDCCSPCRTDDGVAQRVGSA